MQGDSTQSRILAAAADHLRRLGLARLRVVGVAEDVGITHANVYRYFPSKIALADAVIGQWLKGIEVGLLETLGAPDPADDKLERMLNLIARGYRDKLEHDSMMFDVFAEATERDRVIARRHRTRVRELLERVIDEGISNQIFASGDRARIVAFVFDAAYRFIHPVAIRLDRNAPPHNLKLRREIILNSLVRTVVQRRLTT